MTSLKAAHRRARRARRCSAAEGVELADDAEIHVNPTGRFVIGGPMGDAGLTGRKIIVDTYGGMGRHGGGAFSGKDCTQGGPLRRLRGALGGEERGGRRAWPTRCEIQVAYAIGMARPVSRDGRHVRHEQGGRGRHRARGGRRCSTCVPLPSSTGLDLRRPIYRKTAAYGHFGRELPEFTWERTDKADELRRACGLA